MTPKALNQLRDVIGVWSDNTDPTLSMIENIGEIAFCLRLSCIEMPVRMNAALSYVGIWTLNFCAIEKIQITDVYTKLLYDNPREALKALVLHTHVCLIPDNRDREEIKFAIQYIFESLCCLSKLVLKREYFEVLTENWNRIKQQ